MSPLESTYITALTKPDLSCVIWTTCDWGLRSSKPVLSAFGISLTAVLHFDEFLSPWKLKPSWILPGLPSYGSAFVP